MFLSQKLTLILLPLAFTLAAEQISSNLLAATQESSLVAQNQQTKPYRLALIVGNSDYQKQGDLSNNPINDANDLAKALKELGFEVILRTNANQKEMTSALEEFSGKFRQGGIALFFYAGHGIQVDGENYLISVDAKLEAKADVVYETLPVGKVLGRMEDAGNEVNIIILDACRNNPFGRNWTRSIDRGLAQVTAPTGSFIAYATAPGKLAENGTGRNGLFTQHILKHIKTPNLSISDLFQQVRQGVVTQTRKKQVPWDSSSLIGKFSFNPAVEPQNSANLSQPKPQPQPSGQSLISSTSTLDLRKTLQSDSGWIRSVAISPNGKILVTGGRSKTIKVWDLANASVLKNLQGHTREINSVAISRDGKTLVSGSLDGTIKVWDLVSGSLGKTLQNNSLSVNSLAISPDSKTLVSGNFNKTIEIWDLASGSLLKTLDGHSQSVKSVAITPDGKTIVSGSLDNTIKVWNLASGSLIKTLDGHAKGVNCIAISPDGKTVVSGSWDNTIKVWDLASGSLRQTLQGHSDLVLSVAISPDGKTLVSGSTDKTIEVWDLASGSLIQTLEGHEDLVLSVAISPDGKTLVSGSWDETIKVWQASK